MPEANSTRPAKPASPRQVLLGLFILFQIFFLVCSNLVGLIKRTPGELTDRPEKLMNRAVPHFVDREGHAWKWCDQLDKDLHFWTQLTGQDEHWSLFAPAVGKTTGFPAVLLLWDEPATPGVSIPGALLAFDEKNGFNLWSAWNPQAKPDATLSAVSHLSVLAARQPWDAVCLHAACRLRNPPHVQLLLSENEPADVQHYFRVGKCRLRRYEGQLDFRPRPASGQSPAQAALHANERLREFLASYGGPAQAYLRMRLQAWQRAHPDAAAPKQVILCHRYYRIHGPDESPPGWDGPLMIPMARWQPALAPALGLEPFDFAEQRFVPNR